MGCLGGVGVINGEKGRLSSRRRDKKTTPALGASLPIPFRSCISWPAMHPPFGALQGAGCHGFSPPLVAAVRPCIGAWHSPPSLPSLRFVSVASSISCALLRFATTHSFATTLRFAASSLSRALPCPQGLLLVHVRHPAGPLRLRLRFCPPAVIHG